MNHLYWTIRILGITLLFSGLALNFAPALADAAEANPATATEITADFNGSGAVSITDLAILKACIDDPACQNTQFDLNKDSEVTDQDLALAREALLQEIHN